MTEVWLHTMSWNEERMLPFFFRHYDRWVDRYIIYDDGSTDRTLEMFAAHPRVEVRQFSRVIPGSFVASATWMQNRVWKDARGHAAWVVITAIDEHLHHPDIRGYLARCRQVGVTVIPALGFQMLADRFPTGNEWLAETHCVGAPYDLMNKLSIFDPNAIDEINYAHGRHSAAPTGRVRIPATDELVNLHYKYLGLEYLLSRQRLLFSGLGTLDRQAGLGTQYSLSADEQQAEWRRFVARGMDYRDASARDVTHPRRWWLPAPA